MKDPAGAARPQQNTSKKGNCFANINFAHVQNLTQQALSIEYGRSGLSVFPINYEKTPIVDKSLGFTHGLKDATMDPKLIARTWWKYPDAGIGLALPRDLMVLDCDIQKDSQKKPVMHDGKPNIIGFKSFQDLVLKLNLGAAVFDTLSVRTQSGGLHFYYRMPEGESFNHTHALKGLDLKGYGGYVILPNSQGQYGRYEFLNLTEIRPMPEPLLHWVLQFRGPKSEFRKLPAGTASIDREEIVRTLTPYWAKGDGRRNDLTMAIAGFIARSGGSENDATFIITKLSELTGRGKDHISGAKYAFHRERKIRGFYTLTRIMEEIANDRK